MRYVVFLLVLLTGCKSTSMLPRQDTAQLHGVMEAAEKRVVSIKLYGQREVKGRLQSINADTLYWTDFAENEPQASSLAELDYIVVPSRARISLGLMAAAVLGAILTKVKEPECHTDACTVETLGYAYAKMAKGVGFGLLGLLGFAIGQMAEPTEEFVFTNTGVN